MRTYEALYIVKPDLEDDTIQTIAKGVEKLVTDNGGAIVRSETWGNRRLAYEVKGYSEGCYILLRFTAEAAVVKQMEGYFRLSEEVIRNLIVHFDEHTLHLEAEQERRKEEELRASAEETRRREARRAEREAHDEDDEDDDDEDSEDDEDVTTPIASRSRSSE